MKKLVLIICIITAFVSSGFADLGDNYKISCQRFHGRGKVVFKSFISWHFNPTYYFGDGTAQIQWGNGTYRGFISKDDLTDLGSI